MNLDYLFFHLPKLIPDPPFFKPDGLGLSIFLTSPGLLYAVRADWRRTSSWILLAAAVAILIPSLLYYGGGWLQYGYRYCARFDPVRHRPVRERGGDPRTDRIGLAGPDPVRRRDHVRRGLLGIWHLTPRRRAPGDRPCRSSSC